MFNIFLSSGHYPVKASTVSEAILEDILKDESSSFECAALNGPAITKIKYKEDIDFTVNSERWSDVNGQWESNAFLVQMEFESSNSNQSWTARFGTGGNIYSFMGPFGEAIPPQTLDHAPFNDDVLQTVVVDVDNYLVSFDDFVHQAGAYLYRPEKEASPIGIPPPFYSPSVAMHCSEEKNTCRFASWGQQAHLPMNYRSDILFVHQYTNCGGGVLQYTQSVHLMDSGNYDPNTRRQYYLNVPWTGVRTSNLPDMMFSALDGTLHPKVSPLPLFGNVNVVPVSDTGGFTTFAQNGKPNAEVFNLPCVSTVPTTSKVGSDCTLDTSIPLPIQVQSNTPPCAKLNRSSDSYYWINCYWVDTSSFEQSVVAGTVLGGDVSITNVRTGENIIINKVLSWLRGGRFSFQTKTCQHGVTECTGDQWNALVSHINSLFQSYDEVTFAYVPNEEPWDLSPSLTFVHGSPWFGTGSQPNIQYGQGGAATRDSSIFTVDANVHLLQGDTAITRQFLITDIAGNAETKAFEFQSYTSSYVRAHDTPKSTLLSLYCSLELQACTVMLADKTCQNENIQLFDDSGSTTPHTDSIAIFAIQCGNSFYIGDDRYHFSSISNDSYEAHICSNLFDTSIRPTWTLLGFFSRTGAVADDADDFFSGAQYVENLCELPSSSSTPSMSPSTEPSMSPSSTPSISASTGPSMSPSSTLSMLPSVKPSSIPSFSPSFSPSSIPSISPSSTPSMFPSYLPSSLPTIAPTISKMCRETFKKKYLMKKSGEKISCSILAGQRNNFIQRTCKNNISNAWKSCRPVCKRKCLKEPSTAPSKSPSSTPSMSPSSIPSISQLPSLLPTMAPKISKMCKKTFKRKYLMKKSGEKISCSKLARKKKELIKSTCKKRISTAMNVCKLVCKRKCLKD